MKVQKILAALLLSTALISLPGLSSGAFAHDGNSSGKPMQQHCHRGHLSKEQMGLLQTTMLNTREANKAIRAELHDLYQKQHELLSAKQFDKEAFTDNAAQIEAKHDELARSRTEAFASIADKFTPEQREYLARAFARHHGHHHHHGMLHKNGAWQHDGKLAMPPMQPAPVGPDNAEPAAQ